MTAARTDSMSWERSSARRTGASTGTPTDASPGPGLADEKRMTILPSPEEASRITRLLKDHLHWSAFWDKRHGVWRVAEDDPDSDLYAESSDADTVIWLYNSALPTFAMTAPVDQDRSAGRLTCLPACPGNYISLRTATLAAHPIRDGRLLYGLPIDSDHGQVVQIRLLCFVPDAAALVGRAGAYGRGSGTACFAFKSAGCHPLDQAWLA